MATCAARVVFLVLVSAAVAGAEERVVRDAEGRIVPVPVETPDDLRNPWPTEWEDGFRDRADRAIRHYRLGGQGYGTWWFESEKRSYPRAMMDFLAGNREPAVAYLQGPDGMAGHSHGVDLFPCFTLKGQMRKYFFFGPYLDPAYRRTMHQAMKAWTRSDPATRPHPKHGKGTGGPGWTPEVRGYCVDRRNTDNLRAMRRTAVYLAAEETGNADVADLYRERLRRYVWSLYHIGMGEWDSENYHGHTMTGYIQLYDFADDRETRLLGKAAMDWLCAAGAVKYFRGGFGGPGKRDYNKPVAFRGSAADHLHLYFGDAPVPNPDPSHDQVHFVTSAYRPPPAVVALARKRFRRPCELLISHPPYENWKADADGSHAPAYHETQYLGHTFQMGTLPRGSRGDVNGFKLMACNARRGVDYFVPAPTRDVTKVCSAGHLKGRSAVGQYRNLALWLIDAADAPFIFLVPKTARIETAGRVTFLEYEKTWLALTPVNLTRPGVDEGLTRRANYRTDKNGRPKNDPQTGRPVPRWPGEQILAARGTGGPYCGFALEVGEAGTHGDLDAFRRAVRDKARLDTSRIADGYVAYTGARGRSVAVRHADDGLPAVWRNGTPHPWKDHWDLYRNADGSRAPIHLGWKGGTLRVEAGGYVFEGRFRPDGTYRFTNR